MKRIELAPQDRLSGLEDIATEFLQKIFDMDYAEVLMTDESTVWDFVPMFDPEAETRVWTRIFEFYGLSKADWRNKYLVDIFGHIKCNRSISTKN